MKRNDFFKQTLFTEIIYRKKKMIYRKIYFIRVYIYI